MTDMYAKGNRPLEKEKEGSDEENEAVIHSRY
jgi:hypothetical protein